MKQPNHYVSIVGWGVDDSLDPPVEYWRVRSMYT